MTALTAIFAAVFLAAGSTAAAAQETIASERVVDPYQVYSYETMRSDTAELQTLYPGLITAGSIGKSVEGRDLTLIEFGNGSRKIFLCGATHAREYISTSYLMYMIEQYAAAYVNGVAFEGHDITKILDSVTFCIVPMVDPDGVNLVQNGLWSVKDPVAVSKIAINKADKHGYASWKANINGVDLNRNYPDNWYIKTNVGAPASSDFKGYSPLSEPETKAIANFLNNTMCWSYVTYHTQGGALYGWDDENAAFYPQLSSMVSRIIASTGFKKYIGTSGTNYGNFANYVRGVFLKPSLTVELAKYVGSYPYPNEDFDSVWAPAKSISLIVAEEVMKMGAQEYLVYQNDKFLQAFCDKKYALAYAGKWTNSRVLFVKGMFDTISSAAPNDISLFVSDQAGSIHGYNIDGNNYIKLRDLAGILSGTDKAFEIGYDSINKAILITSGAIYTAEEAGTVTPAGTGIVSIVPSEATVYLDDTELSLEAYNAGGSNYFKLQDLGTALDLGVSYDSATGNISLDNAAAN